MSADTAIAVRIEQLERQMRRERFRLNQALEMADAGAWEWDAANDKLWWSPQMFTLYSVDPKQFNGSYKDFEDALDPRCIAEVREHVDACNAQGVPFRMTFAAKNGKRILSSGRMEDGIMHGINMDARFGMCADCPKRDRQCLNCAFWLPPQTGAAYGTCQHQLAGGAPRRPHEFCTEHQPAL